MCGFVGYLAFDAAAEPSAEWMQSMLQVIAHRGPDDDGVLVDGRVALGFRRLAILDLSMAGHQPMTTADGDVSIVFNGEIYNFIELRAELEALGHRIQSTGDTEVLLAAYRQWGVACVERFVGMFAFCILDRRAQQLVVARDRFGVKPLFFRRTHDGILFASELKVIRKSGLWNGALNLARFASFLTLGRTELVPEDESTYLDGVQQVMPGHTCVVRFDGSMQQRCYWKPPEDVEAGGPGDVAEYAARFDDAIRLHVRADVPVGVMLSGGMDSVSIACAMATLVGPRESRAKPLHAFCYLSDDFDESTQLQDAIAQTGVQPHFLRDVDAHKTWAGLEKLMWYHDEPVHSPSVLMGFELYRFAAAEGIRVVLSGQGADETTAGYHTYFENLLVSLALDGRLPALLAQADEVARLSGRTRQEVLARCARMSVSQILSRSPAFRARATRRAATHAAGSPYVSADFRRLAPEQAVDGRTDLHSALRSSVRQGPLPQYLRVEDRNSMAHCIESRVPFLDHRLAEFAMRRPALALNGDGWNKRVMRQAMEGRIPESVRTRREKFGFMTSAKRWFAGPLTESLRAVIADGPAMRSGWFDKPAVSAALDSHVAGRSDATNLLFNVAQMNAWLANHERDWQ